MGTNKIINVAGSNPMTRLARTVLAVVAIITSIADVAQAASPLPGARKASCPKVTPEALPGDALVGATTAALAEAHTLYGSTNLTGMRATEAVLATFNGPRGGYSTKCGGAVRTRTVVVELEFPAEKPSSSLSQGVLLVSRFAGKYRVWALLH